MLCYKERHPLQLKWFVTFLRYMRKFREASDSIYKPLIVHIESFMLLSTLKLNTKYQI